MILELHLANQHLIRFCQSPTPEHTEAQKLEPVWGFATRFQHLTAYAFRSSPWFSFSGRLNPECIEHMWILNKLIDLHILHGKCRQSGFNVAYCSISLRFQVENPHNFNFPTWLFIVKRQEKETIERKRLWRPKWAVLSLNMDPDEKQQYWKERQRPLAIFSRKGSFIVVRSDSRSHHDTKTCLLHLLTLAPILMPQKPPRPNCQVTSSGCIPLLFRYISLTNLFLRLEATC